MLAETRSNSSSTEGTGLSLQRTWAEEGKSHPKLPNSSGYLLLCPLSTPQVAHSWSRLPEKVTSLIRTRNSSCGSSFKAWRGGGAWGQLALTMCPSLHISRA